MIPVLTTAKNQATLLRLTCHKSENTCKLLALPIVQGSSYSLENDTLLMPHCRCPRHPGLTVALDISRWPTCSMPPSHHVLAPHNLPTLRSLFTRQDCSPCAVPSHRDPPFALPPCSSGCDSGSSVSDSAPLVEGCSVGAHDFSEALPVNS